MKNFIFAVLFGFFATVASATPVSPGVALADGVIAPITRQITLKQIGNQSTLYLRGTEGRIVMTLAGNADELVTRAVLRLHYTFSPALIPLQSHLRIAINDEIVGMVVVTEENRGRKITQDVEIDPRMFTDFNQIRFDLIGHYTEDCEDPLHTSLWTEVSGSSRLELTIQPLTLKNDLALLPQPFFNAQDFSSKLSVPFVFPATPEKTTLNSAGIVSSWLGKLAAWRGARFPARLNSLPSGHAIVFVDNKNRPDFLHHYPEIKGPGLEMMTNPTDGHSKLLLVLGRDGNDHKVAAQTLVLGNAALSGGKVSIGETRAEIPRQPYDAPNWVRLDRPMKFGELVSSAQELQVSGHFPEPVRIRLRVPADLFTWRSRGVPIDLKYRYTPPIRASESRLRMSINDELVKTLNLLTSGDIEKDRIRLPLLDETLFGEAREILLPAFKLGTRNELQFHFANAYQKEGLCKDSIVENVRSMIDADSKLDFTGFPHYAEMPNLNFFATSGYPFTKFADLSQTVVVLPQQATHYDIETMLTLMGRMGESTGYPATQFRIAHPDEGDLLKDADLLVIGSSLQQGQLANWADRLPVDVKGAALRISQPKRSVNFLYNWFNFETDPDPGVLAQQQLSGNGSLAAMLGFESPLSGKRSVVAVVATQPSQLPQVLDALEDGGLVNSIQGSAAFIHANKVEGFLVGPTYFVGELPFWTSIWYPFANHPVLLALLAVIAVLVFAFALWRTLKLLAGKRLNRES
ncbi:MAG: cellulose biosynthesis cyclic di-GMP-binding regulatory protein BcsB [Pseudomonadota bacterium]